MLLRIDTKLFFTLVLFFFLIQGSHLNAKEAKQMLNYVYHTHTHNKSDENIWERVIIRRSTEEEEEEKIHVWISIIRF